MPRHQKATTLSKRWLLPKRERIPGPLCQEECLFSFTYASSPFPVRDLCLFVAASCYVLTFDPAPKKMHFQGDAPEGSDTFQWPVIERDRVGGLRLIIWDKVKVPLCQYRLMHRKRVTSELHDSYFRLMTIKHSISKIQWAIVWALNYYLTQLSSSPRSSCQWNSRLLETSCGREGHTRPRGPSGIPMEWTPASGEQERHNVMVITVGSKCYSLCSVSSSLLHANLEQPFRTLAIK